VRVVVDRKMLVHVRFFAAHREATGQSAYQADVPAGTRAREAMRLLIARFPALDGHASAVAYAVNQTVVPPDTELHEGDELALLPPMAGG
jgi:molybdopterin converting factor subunit 1